MAGEWYYTQDQEQQGPVPEDQLKELIASGQVNTSESVWQDGMAEWQTISSMPELASAAPAPDTPAPDTPPPIKQGPPPRGGYTRRGGPPIAGTSQWKLLMLVGAALFFLAFFVPWWGVSVKNMEPDRDRMRDMTPKQLEKFQEEMEELAEKMEEMGEIVNDRSIDDWYESHGVDEEMRDKQKDADEDTKKISVWLWGWSVATGWVAFLFGLLLIAPIVVVAMVVKPIRDWAWIGSFVVAILGLVVLIMSLMWVFGAPGKNVSPMFAQGNILGPYMTLLGSLAVLGSGITDAVFGLMAFIKRGP